MRKTKEGERMNKRDKQSLRGLSRRWRAEDRAQDADGWWSSSLVFRISCALLGVATGSLLALLLGVAGAALGGYSDAMGTLLAAGAMSGAACGALTPNILLHAITGLAYFLAGLLSALGGEDIADTISHEGWLKACVIVGAFYVLGLSIGWGVLR
ncbi:hypothetical protein OIN59_22925 [Acidovorax sp. D2M1]|uniref:Uncharacterized protein n=1 Tax=Acidovorax benzenivorans TaxID=2987520 RepID=A0ABT5S2W2_9BURK|nr:hypothetical protein [Acidovorax benzenivorans]MDD2180303.1 hypothetical protein [Acidovorax benzenivorans]